MSITHFDPLFDPTFWWPWPLKESEMLTPDTTAEAHAPPDTAAPLFKLATSRKHVYGPRTIVPAYASQTTHEQHEWKCQCCGLTKITVLPRGQEGYRMYRWGADGVQFEAEREPGCGEGGRT